MQNDKAPERIWLATWEQDGNKYISCVTSDEPSNEFNVEYIRADLVGQWLKRANDKVDELQSFVDCQQGFRYEWKRKED